VLRQSTQDRPVRGAPRCRGLCECWRLPVQAWCYAEGGRGYTGGAPAMGCFPSKAQERSAATWKATGTISLRDSRLKVCSP